MTERATEDRTERVLEALRAVIDPELGLNVVDLGLVYGVELDGEDVRVILTMTTPACPLGEMIREQAESAVEALEDVRRAQVELVWEPPWEPSRMSASAKALLGW